MDELELDAVPSLANLVQRERPLIEEVCQSYVDLFQVAVKVLDADGNRLIEVASRADLCQYIYGIPPCRQACIHIVTAIRHDNPEFRVVTPHVCFSGAEYRSAPIHAGTDVIGKLVFGPFLPEEVVSPPGHFLAMDEAVDPETAWAKTNHFQRVERELAEGLASNLASVVEIICFMGHKGQLTTDMHVQSMTEAYQEVARKNRELEGTVSEMRRLNQQRSAFLSSVSEELRSPLTNLIGYAEMLLEGFGEGSAEDQREFLQAIIDHGEQVLQVTDTMEELARIDRGELELAREPAPLAELLDAAVAPLRPQAAAKDVNLEVDAIPAGLPTPQLDVAKVRAILGQLLDNAVKFTPAGGRVSVACRLATPQVGAALDAPALEIAVSDSGIGIDPSHHAHLFEPFYTVHTGPHRAYHGAGVGLAIAHAYAEAHGGEIAVESRPDAGSTFTLRLPMEGERLNEPRL
jgi:two-component system sensor histidine kinase BarA